MVTHSHDPRTRPGPRRRTIVTGGAGFIGSHLVDRLIADGDAVLVIDDMSSGSSEHLAIDGNLEELDIAGDDLMPAFNGWRPDVVYHLAAQASVPLSIQAPLRDLEVNVVGTHRVAVAARAVGARRLVFVSSGGAIYGATSHPASEVSLPAPTSFYGVHKLAAEGHVALGGLPFAIARPSNVYGPRQAAGLEGAVVAAFLDQAATSGTLRIHGDGRQTRDFVHVSDVVDALIRLGQTEAPSRTWNISSGESVTILRLAEIVERTLDRRLNRESAPLRPGDVRHSAISAALLTTLGWFPKIGLASGIDGLVGFMPNPNPKAAAVPRRASRPSE